MIEVNIKGIEQINNVLKALDKNVRGEVITTALDNVSKEILNKAESNVWEHQHTGRVYRSLGIQRNGTKLLRFRLLG